MWWMHTACPPLSREIEVKAESSYTFKMYLLLCPVYSLSGMVPQLLSSTVYINSKLASMGLCRVDKSLSICCKSFGKCEFHHFSADWVRMGPECGKGCSTTRRSWKYAVAVALSKKLWLEGEALNCPIHMWVKAARPACPTPGLRLGKDT